MTRGMFRNLPIFLQDSHRVILAIALSHHQQTGLQETNDYDLIGNTTVRYMIDRAQPNVTTDNSLSQNYKRNVSDFDSWHFNRVQWRLTLAYETQLS